MATYRVYIARPETQPLVWDWAQTVVAPAPDVALGRAYADWQRSTTSPVPPLSQCRTRVTTIGALLETAAISEGPQAFIDIIETQVSKLLSTQLDGTFKTVIYPAGFNYGITYGTSAFYNRATLRDIDSQISVNPSNGRLMLAGGGFSNLYLQIMQGVAFSFSEGDQATINKQDTAAQGQVASVLTEFENIGGTYSNPLPLGGKLQDVFNQLTKQFGGVDKLPDTLNALRNAIASYKAMAGASYALHNRYYAASERLAASVANTKNPSASNGGQQVDANNYYAGYTPSKLPTVNQLIGSLSTESNAVKVEINLNNFSSTSCRMSLSGGAAFNIPIGDFLGISVNSSASYDVSRYTSSSTSITMDMTYPGVTKVAATPSALSSDNTTGWYAEDIVKEVAVKTGQDATGYQLQGSEFNVEELFGLDKEFSRLKTFVISQQPTITLTFSGTDADKITSDLKKNASVQLTLFGMFTLGSAAGSYSVQKVDTNSSTGTVTVTFGPPKASGTIPLQQQVAYVLGGVPSYPPKYQLS